MEGAEILVKLPSSQNDLSKLSLGHRKFSTGPYRKYNNKYGKNIAEGELLVAICKHNICPGTPQMRTQ